MRTGAIKAERPPSFALNIARNGSGRSVSWSLNVFPCDRMSTIAGYSVMSSDFPYASINPRTLSVTACGAALNAARLMRCSSASSTPSAQ